MKKAPVYKAKASYQRATPAYFKSDYKDTTEAYCSFASNGNRSFIDFDTNISVRSEFNRSDYNYFRPNEKTPDNIEDIIYWSMEAYKKIGIINNVINLMGDFTSQGIKFVHPNRKIQKFHDKLAEQWKAGSVSERFANTLYRCGTVVIHGLEGKISIPLKNKWSQTAKVDVVIRDEKVEDKTIPLKYIIYHPLSLEILNKASVSFTAKPVFGLKLNQNLLKDINYELDYDKTERILNNSLTTEIFNKIKGGSKLLPLDVDKVNAYYYKKDDWEFWGTPVTAPILDDLVRLEKLNLADMSALDGAISQIRHWKIGSLEHKIAPSPALLNKMRSILANNSTGGVRELVTGPEIDFKESDTKVHQFLGSEKYQATLTAIYAGLGIPPTLTGVSTASGFTNNYISIKTLVERLEYGRTKLIEFWQLQLNKVAEAMGFKVPAKVIFDQMILSDESAEKALLLQLVDRDIISFESIRSRFDLDDEIERLRVDREHLERKEENSPQRASPYHNAQQMHDYYKLLLSGGDVTPEELGIKLEPRKPGSKTRLDKQMEQKKYAPPGPNGRPKNKKDTEKRKPKVVKPRTSAELFVWAVPAFHEVGRITSHIFLSMLKAKNVRSLTVSQTAALEQIKNNVFSNIEPFTQITENLVYNHIEKIVQAPSDFNQTLFELSESFIQTNKRKPNTEELRNLVVASYVELKST